MRIFTHTLIALRTKYSYTMPLLGRWTIKNTYTTQNRVVDLNNIDHCGCCDYKYEHDTGNEDDELIPYVM